MAKSPPAVYVAASGLGEQAGMGLYAARAYRRGERIMEYTGELLNEEQFEARYGGEKLGRYVLEISKKRFIDARDAATSGPARYVNDCRRGDKERGACKGNNVQTRAHGKRAFLYAARSIAPGDELFWNYGRSYWKNRD
jgi:uncharacterized protein